MSEKKQILIVDKSRAVQKYISNLLEPLNSNISMASNGTEAFEKAKKNNYDIIITDIGFQKINGVSLCQMLQDTESTKAVPVIILSSFDSDEDVARGFQAGASAYISKRDADIDLFKVVNKILRESEVKKDKTILVIDDSMSIRLLIKEGLTKAGYSILEAENGKEALDILQNEMPDLILCDINMPVMDGFQFCRAVQDTREFSFIPFIVMSVNDDKANMKKMMQLGASAYLVKPFNLDELIILIERLLTDQFLLLLKEKERLDSERKLMLAGITSLISALEARDPYTKGHSEMVAFVISGMVAYTGANDHEIESAYIGGKLHDIGKIGVRDRILLKPGKLSLNEFCEIKEHPVIGANILNTIPNFKDIMDIVMSHHERMDGKGYPQGLKFSKVPKLAGIAAVADTFHALTSDRPYRKGLSKDRAFQIIEDAKGTQLLPEYVDLFFKWYDNNDGKSISNTK